MVDRVDMNDSMQRGLQLLVEGRHVEAFDEVARIAEEAPGDARVWELLGTIALEGGRPGTAFTAFEKGHSLTGDLDSAMNMISAAYHAIDYATTKRLAAEAVGRWPESAEAKAWDAKMAGLEDEFAMMVDVGKTLHREGRQDDALDVLLAALQLEDDPEARLWAGRAFLASGNATSAASFLESVAGVFADDPEVAVDTATAHAMGDRRDIARAYLDEAARIHPRDASVMEATARLLVDGGDYAGALGFAESAVAASPGRGTAWFTLAVALEAAGRIEEARLAIDRSIGLEPDEPFHWGLGARLVETTGDTGLAARYREKASRIAGVTVDPQALPPLGDLRAEVQRLYSQIQKWPAHVLAYRDRATINRLLGEHERALYYLDVVERDLMTGSSAPLLTERSSVLTGAGRVQEARGVLERALATDPAFGPARVALEALGATEGEREPQPAAARPAFCSACGSPFPDGAEFCGACGARRSS